MTDETRKAILAKTEELKGKSRVFLRDKVFPIVLAMNPSEIQKVALKLEETERTS